MKIRNMVKGDWGKVKAFFNVEIGPMGINGFKIISGVNGLFVGFPQIKKKDEWENLIFMLKEDKDEFQEMAINLYNDLDIVVPDHKSYVGDHPLNQKFEKKESDKADTDSEPNPFDKYGPKEDDSKFDDDIPF